MEAQTVLAFLAVDLLLALTPGADWAHVIAAGLRDRTVLPAVTGVVAGYAVHTALVVTGVAVLVAGSPRVLDVLTVAGAGYLVWLGASTLARPAGPSVDGSTTPRSRLRASARGALTSGLNPKGFLLYLALLPQFVDAEAAWPVAAQTGLLGAVHMGVCAVVYLGVGVLARRLLVARPTAARVVTRVSGIAMVGIGLFLVAERVMG